MTASSSSVSALVDVVVLVQAEAIINIAPAAIAETFLFMGTPLFGCLVIGTSFKSTDERRSHTF